MSINCSNRLFGRWRRNSSRETKWSAVLCAALLLVLSGVMLLSPRANAQVLYGSLNGIVTDANGAAIVGVKVEAVEMNKGIHQDAVTGATGLYRFSELLTGLWKITVSAPGFNKAETDNIQVVANTVARVDVQLAVAKVNETVTVTTAPPELQTDRADVHTDISTEELQQLPQIGSEGKTFQSLLRIIPGATLPQENNSAAGNPARSMTANVNGQSSQGNGTRIDGISDTYPWLPNNVAYVPPSDGIDTVNIATNSYDAEQGGVNGAAVNVQIKTGSNKFHGDAHEFHTDDQLKALNYFITPATFHRPVLIFNQYGGAVGGPIKKDKLFFFGDWESTRQIQAPAGGNPQTVPFGSLVASTAATAGYFDFRPFQTAAYGLVDSAGNPVHIYDPNTGNANGSGRQPISCNGIVDTICLGRVDPAALTMAKLIPAPTASLATLDTNNYLDTSKGKFNRDNYDAKINYVPTQKSTVFGHFSFSNGDIFDPPSLGPAEGNATNGGQLGNAFTKIYVIGLGGTHTFTQNLLLDANLGFTRQHLSALALDISQGPYGLKTLMIPGTNNAAAPNDQLYYGIPAFQFTTFTNLGNPNTGNPFVFRDNQFVENENLTWIKGHHQFRFGGEWDHVLMNHFQPQGAAFQTARGSFQSTGIATEQATCANATTLSGCTATDAPKNMQYNSYADFLLGLPWQTGRAVQNTDPIALRWNQFAIYGRDMWQVTPKLSVDLGLRWERFPMAYSDHDKGARVLNPTTMQVLIGGYGSVPKNDGVQVGFGEILPRVGIDYRINDKTVVRGGFGIGGDDNNWRYLRNDYPADTISAFNGQATGGPVSYTQFAPGASLTGLNATGPYAQLPIGILPIVIPSFSTGSIPLPNGVNTSTVGSYPNFRRGYIYSYNLTVERELAGFVANIGYVGDREVRAVTNLNLNSAPAGGGAAGEILNQKFGASYGSVNTLIPLTSTFYNSMQAQVTRKIGQGSQWGMVYTWSKAEDSEDNEELNGLSWNYPAYMSRNKALSGFDRTSIFTTYWLYNLPFGKGQPFAQHGIAGALAGGWALSGVLSRLSGTPFTITDNSGASNLNSPGNQQTPNIVSPIHLTKGKPYQPTGNCAKGTNSCSYFDITSFASVTTAATFGSAGRNIIRGPGYFDIDGTLTRDFKIREYLTFQFEAQAISLTNTPHFANPDGNITDANFGKVTGEVAAANASLGGSGGERQWWFGGKFIF